MVGMGQAQYGVAQHHHQLFIFAAETAGQRLIANFLNYPLPYPLPELRLGGPELFLILTDYKGGIFLSLLLVFGSFQHGGIKELSPATTARCYDETPRMKLPGPIRKIERVI